MAVSLSKGQKVDLTKGQPGLNNLLVGLGWDPSQSGMDLDASVFLLAENGKVTGEQDFVFYNNPQGGQGSVIYSGDNRSGQGVQDDEQIRIDLRRVPQHVHRIAFTITIHEGESRRQNFGQVQNAYVRALDEPSGQVLVQYNLGRDFSVETAVVVAELYRYKGEWKFSATGSGFSGGLAALCHNFGIEVESPQPSPSAVTGNAFGSNPAPSYQQEQPQRSFTPQQSYNNTMPAGRPMGGSVHNPMQGTGPSHSSGSGFTCSRCGSQNIMTGKKGFGLGKAAIGGLVLGPIGLLGGFIGGNKLKLTCVNCNHSWEPGQSEISRITDTLKNQAKNVIQQYKTAESLDGIVAGLALVAMADGRLEHAEKQKVQEFITQSPELSSFGPGKALSKFDYFVGNMTRDHYRGKEEALGKLHKLRSKPDLAKLVVRYCVAVGYADGDFSYEEQQMVSDICRMLNLNPSEFLY
ncbi:TerD family protein [Peribacillus deserti]|uniref:Tellurium resistance protein TerD n=1 Tax=Peribacillus deserti TaxID=673318 RepID=A0A2N5MAT4_9BACI|nr:TerD family protein [Peribacillus deserti]PLT31415.1 tellurium resistance protein TerD [Peribacillus deserti]